MYCTVSDIKKSLSSDALLQIADDDKTGVVKDEIISNVINLAEALVDAFIEKRYNRPLSEVPVLIQKITTDIAIAYLYNRYPFLNQEFAAKLFNEAIKLLGKIARGEISPGGTDTGSPHNFSSSTTKDESKTFSQDSLEDF